MRQYLIALSAVAFAAATPLAAKDLTIKYSDLNLRSEKGQKELSQRIDTAAREYCGMDSRRVGTRLRAKGATQCYHDARNAARESMDQVIAQAQLGG